MSESVVLKTINTRYSALSESNCCLSCGGAVDKAPVKPGDFCLDLGSGRGNDVIRMADKAGQNGHAYGLDVSDGMIRKAERNAQKLGIENVSFIQSELEVIPLENDSIDIIISNCTINHAADKDKVWKEIYRVLKNSGRFVISDIYSTEIVPDTYKNDPVAISECWAGSDTRDIYIETLKNAGFDDIIVHEESEPYAKGEIKVVSWTIEGIKK